MGPLTTYTGELIRAIERGERTCEVANLELLAAYERSERLGRPLNAIVELFPAPLRSPEGPLHGVQIAVKDIIDIAGHPRGSGNPHAMRSTPAKKDAPITSALRAAGADVFAATSLLEYAAGATHPEVPEAMNPYNPNRTAGGSSGGSAALVGVGACSIALGTDTGGSIRIPAHYCATVGFKPTYGVLSLEGVQALSPTLDAVGLIARDVTTTIKVFAALTTGSNQSSALRAVTAVRGPLRIGVITGQLELPEIQLEVVAALRNAIEVLTLAGCSIVPVDGGAFDELDESVSDIVLFEAWQTHGAKVISDPDHFGPETLRLLRTSQKLSQRDYQQALVTRSNFLPAALKVYEGVDVLLSPAAPFVAPVTTPPVDTPEGSAEGMFTVIHNLTGAPALVLPCGWSSNGLPIGVQLSSAVGTDMALLAAARYVEATLDVENRAPAIH